MECVLEYFRQQQSAPRSFDTSGSDCLAGQDRKTLLVHSAAHTVHDVHVDLEPGPDHPALPGFMGWRGSHPGHSASAVPGFFCVDHPGWMAAAGSLDHLENNDPAKITAPGPAGVLC